MKQLAILLLFANLAYGQTVRHVIPSGGVSSGEATTVGTGWAMSWLGNASCSADPGDTVYIHGGIYTGPFDFVKDGTASSPIIYRNYPGDTVRIRTTYGQGILNVAGDYSWIWGLIIERHFTDSTNTTHVYPTAPGFKMINCILKNSVGNSCPLYRAVTGGEAYGNIFVFSGNLYNTISGNKRGYPIYVQNHHDDGWKYIRENIMSWPWQYAVHGYTANNYLQNIEMRGNVSINSGWLHYNGSGSTYSTSFLLAVENEGIAVADSITYAHDYVWTNGTSGYGGIQTQYGYGPPTNVKIDSCISIAGNYSLYGYTGTVYRSLIGNKFAPGWLPSNVDEAYPNNQWLTSRPSTGDTAIVRMNAYETKRAHLIVYNWDGGDSVSINPTGFAAGDMLTIKNVQNIEGDTPYTRRYQGVAFNIPMMASRWSIETPIPSAAPQSYPTGALPETFPSFGAFLITGVASGEELGAITGAATSTLGTVTTSSTGQVTDAPIVPPVPVIGKRVPFRRN